MNVSVIYTIGALTVAGKRFKILVLLAKLEPDKRWTLIPDVEDALPSPPILLLAADNHDFWTAFIIDGVRFKGELDIIGVLEGLARNVWVEANVDTLGVEAWGSDSMFGKPGNVLIKIEFGDAWDTWVDKPAERATPIGPW